MEAETEVAGQPDSEQTGPEAVSDLQTEPEGKEEEKMNIGTVFMESILGCFADSVNGIAHV